MKFGIHEELSLIQNFVAFLYKMAKKVGIMSMKPTKFTTQVLPTLASCPKWLIEHLNNSFASQIE